MWIALSSGLSDQNLVTKPQCYKDRQNRSSLLSVSMHMPPILVGIKKMLEVILWWGLCCIECQSNVTSFQYSNFSF